MCCSQRPSCKQRTTRHKRSLSLQHCVGVSLPFCSLVVFCFSQTQQEKVNMLHRLCSHRPLSWVSVCSILDACFAYWGNRGRACRAEAACFFELGEIGEPQIYSTPGVEGLFWAEYCMFGRSSGCPRVKTLHLFLSLFTQKTSHSGGGVEQSAQDNIQHVKLKQQGNKGGEITLLVPQYPCLYPFGNIFWPWHWISLAAN